MCGELGLDIAKIEIRKFQDNNYEMTFYDKELRCLHIVGDNDLVSLLTEALNNIKDYTQKLNGGTI